MTRDTTTTTRTAAEQFFYEHAGYSVNRDEETHEKGHDRSARELATAEAWAEKRGYWFDVQPDDDIETTTTDEQIERIAAGETVYLTVLMYNPDEVCQSLGGTEVTSENDPYLRVVKAELALEEMLERREVDR
jgi:hypothetical protein